MKSLFTFQRCCCFSGNVLWLHQFSSNCNAFTTDLFLLPLPPQSALCLLKSSDSVTLSRTTISAALPACFGSLSLAANVCTLWRECSQCQFRTQTLWQGLFSLPLRGCEVHPYKHLDLFPSIFNRKMQGLVISFSFVLLPTGLTVFCSAV